MTFHVFRQFHKETAFEQKKKALDAAEYRKYESVYTPLEFRLSEERRRTQREAFINALAKADTEDADFGAENTTRPKHENPAFSVSFREEVRSFTELGKLKNAARTLKERIIHGKSHEQVRKWYPRVLEEQELTIELITASKLGDMRRFREANEKLNGLPHPSITSKAIESSIKLLETALVKLREKSRFNGNTAMRVTERLESLKDDLLGVDTKLGVYKTPKMLTETKVRQAARVMQLGGLVSFDILAPISEYWRCSREEALGHVKLSLLHLERGGFMKSFSVRLRNPSLNTFYAERFGNDFIIDAPRNHSATAYADWLHDTFLPYLTLELLKMHKEETESHIATRETEAQGAYEERLTTGIREAFFPSTLPEEGESRYSAGETARVFGTDFARVFSGILDHLSARKGIGLIIRRWRVTSKRSERFTLAVSHKDKVVIVRPTHAMNLRVFIGRIGHEVLHIVRAAFGGISQFRLLEKGLPGTKAAEEGVAILIEKITEMKSKADAEVRDESESKLPRVDRYLAIVLALGMDKGNVIRSFLETFLRMETYYLAELLTMDERPLTESKPEGAYQQFINEARKLAYQTCQRVYDGTDGKNAVNTTDLHYAEGACKIASLIDENPGELPRLIIGGRYDPTNREHCELLDQLGIRAQAKN